MAAKIRSAAAISRNGEFRLRPPEESFAFGLSDTDMWPPDYEGVIEDRQGMRCTMHSSTSIRLAERGFVFVPPGRPSPSLANRVTIHPIRYSWFVQLADDFWPTVSRAQFKHDFAETVRAVRLL